MTVADANQAEARQVASITSEENRRKGQSQMLDLQRAALVQASMPVVCNSFGGMTTCY